MIRNRSFILHTGGDSGSKLLKQTLRVTTFLLTHKSVHFQRAKGYARLFKLFCLPFLIENLHPFHSFSELEHCRSFPKKIQLYAHKSVQLQFVKGTEFQTLGAKFICYNCVFPFGLFIAGKESQCIKNLFHEDFVMDAPHFKVILGYEASFVLRI